MAICPSFALYGTIAIVPYGKCDDTLEDINDSQRQDARAPGTVAS